MTRCSSVLAEIIRMVASGKPVDVITVAEELSAQGHDEQTGGLAYLGELAANSAGSRNGGLRSGQLFFRGANPCHRGADRL